MLGSLFAFVAAQSQVEGVDDAFIELSLNEVAREPVPVPEAEDLECR